MNDWDQILGLGLGSDGKLVSFDDTMVAMESWPPRNGDGEKA